MIRDRNKLIDVCERTGLNPDSLRIAEASALFDISTQTLYSNIYKGLLKTVTREGIVNKAHRVSVDGVLAFIAGAPKRREQNKARLSAARTAAAERRGAAKPKRPPANRPGVKRRKHVA